MKIYRHNSIKTFLIYLMVSIISLVVVNEVFFMHSHVMADGSVVTHSHPFNKSSEKGAGTSHSHSFSAFQFISTLDFLFFSITLFCLFLFQHQYKSLPLLYKNFRKSLLEYFTPGRSPPFIKV